MPKLNKTMLDKLASMMKSSGGKKPAIIQKATWKDPLSGSIVGRKVTSFTPERQKYQRGIDNIRDFHYDRSIDELNDLQRDFDDAFYKAKENMIDDFTTDMDYIKTPNLREGFSRYDDLMVDMPSGNLEDHWPSYDYNEPEWFSRRGQELDERLNYIDSPAYRMEVQRQTPRYRRYQDAMMQRAENARLGRLNAKIMYLARQGYSLPEIREILKMQGR